MATPQPTPPKPTQAPATTPAANTNAPKPSRMALSAVVKGKLNEPVRVLLYGPEGVGKSTFAAGAPKPIFIGAEDGTAELDVTRFSSPTGWPDITEAVRNLTLEKHDYETLVLDTIDWAEPMLWEYICKRDNQPNIEAYGYSKGYTSAAMDEWRIFLASLERLIRAKNMNVILLAHAQVRSFKNPEGPDYDRFELTLHQKAGGLVKQWVKAVLFAKYETFAEKDKQTKRAKGLSTGARFMHTVHHAAYDAKNRYGLPETLPLSWEEFEAARRNPGDVENLVAEIEIKAKELGGTLEKHALEAIKRAKGDAGKLAQLNDWTNGKLLEKEQG